MNTTYVQNRFYCHCIDNTPYGLIIKLKPNIAKLHVFGSVCHSYVPNSKEIRWT